MQTSFHDKFINFVLQNNYNMWLTITEINKRFMEVQNPNHLRPH